MTLPVDMPCPRPGFAGVPAAVPEPDGDRVSERLSGARVLIVEDEALIALELEHILGTVGHEVVGMAADARSGIRLAVEHAPDVVLMDVSLGDGPDGIHAAMTVVAETDARIVFVTAHTDERTLDRLGRVGFSRVVAKPFAHHEILAAIRDALEG